MVFQSLDDGAHPFHLHGYKFWDLGGSTGLYSEAARLTNVNNTVPMM